MTAQGEDLLAFLDSVIAAFEKAAQDAREGGDGRWQSGWCPEEELEDGETPGSGVVDERDRTVVYDEGYPTKPQSIHIALNDPASVLRRCAADRKVIELYRSCMAEPPQGHYADGGDRAMQQERSFPALRALRPVIQLLAEGYGWTEGER